MCMGVGGYPLVVDAVFITSLAATYLRGGGRPDPCNCLGLVCVAEQGSIVAPRHVVDPDTLRRWTVAVLGAVVERKDDLLPYQLWFSDVMKMLSHPCLVQGKDMACKDMLDRHLTRVADARRRVWMAAGWCTQVKRQRVVA